MSSETLSRLVLLGTCLFLSGCAQDTFPVFGNDQVVRASRFDACMAALPAGPQRITGGNDWDEVVEACDRASYSQSRICIANCPGAKP